VAHFDFHALKLLAIKEDFRKTREKVGNTREGTGSKITLPPGTFVMSFE
jgi:hypothetical protein